MSRSTQVLTNITFPSERAFTTPEELEQKKNECMELISALENRIYMLAYMTDPKKYCPIDDALSWVQSELNEILDELEIEQYWLAAYSIAQQNILSGYHENGGALVGPDNFRLATRIKGDYIMRVNDKGEPVGLDPNDPIDAQALDNFFMSPKYRKWRQKKENNKNQTAQEK